MPNAPTDQQHPVIQPTVQDETRMLAHLAQYTRSLHDYTLALWTESRRVAQEKDKFMRERHAATLVSAGLPASSGKPIAPTTTQQRATQTAASAPTPVPTWPAADDTTPKAVTPPKSNPVDSAQKTPTPPPASS